LLMKVKFTGVVNPSANTSFSYHTGTSISIRRSSLGDLLLSSIWA
jgi:hypothetical protein